LRVAAVQLRTVVGDITANLAACERLAGAAALEGAEWIVLPEFFTTGVGFLPELAERSLPPDGIATELLLSLARRHGAVVGGSFLCRDADGEVRNAFFLVTPEGVAGRHDKDIPTMWENCFYVGGTDDGLIKVGGLTAGVAMCQEFNRTRTVARLRGRAEVVVADVKVGRIEAVEREPAGFWIQELDPLSKAGWHLQGWHGRRWYRRRAGTTKGRTVDGDAD
jgi:predicted amidohydrolase